jgi:hypothetical protein
MVRTVTALRWRRATLVGVLLFSVGMGGVALAEVYVDSWRSWCVSASLVVVPAGAVLVSSSPV